MDLRNTKDIRMMVADFSMMPNLERLNLEGCTELRKFHPSIAKLAEYLDFDSWSNEDISLLEEMGKPGLKSKNKATSFRMGDAAEARAKASKVKKRSKSEVIDDIVEVTITKLGQKVSALADNLVGIQSRLEALDYLLDLDSTVPNLRGMDLRNTEKMRMMMPDFTRMPNLEMLNLEGCSGLLQLPPSVATLPKLKYLNLKNCINLIKCLDFDSWRSSIEVKVTSNEDVTLLEGITNARLAKKKRASHTEPASSNSIAKCVDDLDKIDGVSNNSYIKALENFQDPYWREVFLTIPCDRKKAWLDSLV
ncbi:disease resistance protein TAO1-like isoform X1 [Senna tora]|uniref:Disease resistance protein TAO1-like isoform X1 n=1 Tax=Senna tora TaxID=362788 RepID=A0A834TKU8_9FABA|nr:disease resistance protein TAO1-like isoform X1 [Senna tora]